MSVRWLLVLLLSSALAACNNHGSNSFVPPSGPQQVLRHAVPLEKAIDAGRRAPSQRVRAVVLLRYNNQRELDRFVATLARTPHPRYLTSAEFISRYALTAAQEQRVVDDLQARGFTIERRYPNRTILDVSAETQAFETTFATEIHDFRQGRYGMRYANVRPVTVPAALKPYVVTVDVSNVVRMHPDLAFLTPANDDTIQLPSIVPPRPDEMPRTMYPASSNAIKNPGFETGKLKPWTSCRSSSSLPGAVVTKLHPHSGRFDAYAGTFAKQPEPNGITSVCQLVTIPSGATLSVYTMGLSDDASKKVAQFGALYDPSTGKPAGVIYTANENNKAWVARSYDLSRYAGKKVLLAFGIAGVSAHRGKAIGQFVDDVSLTAGGGGTPSPSPSPSTSPAAACPSPGSPTPAPTTGPGKGWSPSYVEDGFCYPALFGYTGAGQTAGIVINAEVNPSDLSTYLAQYGISQTGHVTNVLINGANPSGYDTDGEATLDLETIVGQAPAANVVVYVLPSLDGTSIDDAYQSVLTDGRGVTVVNSSFGGCEGGDSTSNSIAEQGAAQGITYSASSGDQGQGCYSGSSTSFGFGVSSPASDPYFVGVGGSQSTSPAADGVNYTGCAAGVTPITNPVVWSDCVGAGGGGLSTEWTTTPSYQVGIAGASQSVRNVPDIAMPAAFDSTYFTGTSNPGWGLVWGTSWASPLYVAMQLEINQACSSPQWGITTLYTGLSKSGYSHFVDVTGGTNAWNQSSGTPYSAGNGFDNVSGIGMPLGFMLAQDECSVAAIRYRR